MPGLVDRLLIDRMESTRRNSDSIKAKFEIEAVKVVP
jgi:hypothetical protein